MTNGKLDIAIGSGGVMFVALALLVFSSVFAGCGGDSSSDDGARDVRTTVFRDGYGPRFDVGGGTLADAGARDIKLPWDVPQGGLDVGADTDPTGAPYTPCEENIDCLYGYCVMTSTGSVCSEPCIENCLPGWTCANVATPPDILSRCVPLLPFLCHPCLGSDECRNLSGSANLCVAYGGDGWFCGGACDEDGDCPDDYVCEERPIVEGGTAFQCVRPEGLCECSSMAVGKETVCFQENEFGRCEASRTCSVDGLTHCAVRVPAAEVCNEIDDDCDGQIDENCDGDDIVAADDNCPATYNPEQEDFDGDNVGDACDGDDDNDGYGDDNDCEPHDPTVHADADEVCDGKDNDCDGIIDEGLCSDDNGCTTDLCDAQGECMHVNNEAPCDDGSVCTTEDRCAGGQCVGGGFMDCNDSNSCTGDACDPLFGCVHHVLEGPCEDGNACTDGEVCVDGECQGGIPRDCADDDPCTSDTCDPELGCVHDADAPCDDGNPCTDDVCQAGSGCINTPNTAPCDDGSVCTTFDQCSQGFCVGSVPLDCTDGDPCTDDLCHPVDGCYHEYNVAPCNDGDPCTSAEACRDGFCQGGQPTDCSDGNPCTEDACLPSTGCIHTSTNPCYDNNPCTVDTCDPIEGCQYLPTPGPCDDNDPCTSGDHCEGGVCTGSGGLDCEDGNPCTDDLCSVTEGCYHVANSAPCDDGNPCTIDDTCQDRRCHRGEPNPCDDGDVCTLDSCDTVHGCRHTSYNPCDDGNICTNDTCEPGVGCVYTPNSNYCDDGDRCTVNDHCEGGACVGNASTACDDGNPCTDDVCLSPSGTCQHANRTGGCEDGNYCTEGDHCYNGRCMAGTPRACNDGEGCTRDSCDPARGCVFDALPMNGSACDDDDACTIFDTCGAGACNPGYNACGYENNCPGYVWIGTCVDIGIPFCVGACF